MKKPIRYNSVDYASYAELCRAYGVKEELFRSRKKSGYSVHDSLTGEGVSLNLGERAGKKVIYKGVEYSSQKELCLAYNVSYHAFKKRKGKGWSIEECLTGIPIKPESKKGKPVEYKGVTYNSYMEVCRVHKVNYLTFTNRIKRGNTVEASITGKGLIKKKPNGYGTTVICYGVTYNSYKDLCRHYNLSYNKVIRMSKKGYSIEECVEEKSNQLKED